MADDKHIVLRWVTGKPALTVDDAALVREALRRCLPCEHVCIRFEGTVSATPDFIAHSIGAMYWYQEGKDPRSKFEPLGMNSQIAQAWKDGLLLARNQIGELMREMKEEKA